MKMVAIMWQSYLNMFLHGCRDLSDQMEIKVYSSKKLEEAPERLDRVLEEASDSDVLFLYRSSEGFWEAIEPRLGELRERVPVVCVSHDPSYWALSTVSPEILARIMQYIGINGKKNFINMVRYVAREVAGLDLDVAEPEPILWEGLYHPESPEVFASVAEYLKWYQPRRQNVTKPGVTGLVGIHFHRHHWVNDDMAVEDALIRALEAVGLDVLPVFSNSFKDEGLGCKGGAQVVQDFFPGRRRVSLHRRPRSHAVLFAVQYR